MILRIVPVLALVILIGGCRGPSVVPVSPASGPKDQAVAPTTVPQSPVTRPTELSPTTRMELKEPGRCVVLIHDLSEPQKDWLVIEEMTRSGEPASATGHVVKPRTVIVETHNVRAIRIELAKAGLPTNRPVILRIDKQGIEITGRYGPVARLERSLQGVWSSRRKPSERDNKPATKP